MTEKEGGGLHIDLDWKTEAAREKKRLAEQERTARKSEGRGAAPGSAGFIDLLNLIAMQAAMALGGLQGPGGEQIPPNPAAAKHHIDLLEVLAEKTQGNLSDEEKRTLDAVLYELRMQYVHTVSAAVPTPKPG